MVEDGQGWLRMVMVFKNSQGWSGWSRIVEDSQEWSGMVEDSQGWSKMIKDGQGWSRVVKVFKDSQGWSGWLRTVLLCMMLIQGQREILPKPPLPSLWRAPGHSATLPSLCCSLPKSLSSTAPAPRHPCIPHVSSPAHPKNPRWRLTPVPAGVPGSC